MKSPQHVSLEEEEDYICTFYSRERLIQLVDFLHDNTSGQLQIEVTKFASALSESQIENAGEVKFKHNLVEHSSELLFYMSMVFLQGEYLAVLPGHSLSSICVYCMGHQHQL